MYSKILVPVDGSETPNRGLAEAIDIDKLTGGRMKLLHVIDAQSLALYPMGGSPSRRIHRTERPQAIHASDLSTRATSV